MQRAVRWRVVRRKQDGFRACILWSDRAPVAEQGSAIDSGPITRIQATIRPVATGERRTIGRGNGPGTNVQSTLVRVDERQLKKLTAKSERRALSPKDLVDYRILVRRAERLDATRLAALTELARRWGKPVRVVMETIGWQESEDETTGHPPRPPKAGARSRR